MRLVVACILALLLAPTLVSASQEEARDSLAMEVVVIGGVGASISWSPAPTAYAYEVYRGPELDQLTFLGATPSTSFFDASTPASEESVWYVVIGRATAQSVGEFVHTMRGKCLATRGMTGYSLTLAHCMPTQAPV